jgi:hypothetical protein
LGYATVVGVEWCVLTNGDEYRLYNSHATVDVEEKLFRVVRLSDPAQDEYSLDTLDLLSKERMGENRLDVLWKAHFVDRHIKAVLDNLLRNEDAGLIRLIRKKTKGISPSEIRESLKRADIRIDFPMVPTATQPIVSNLPGAPVPLVPRSKKSTKQQQKHKQYIGVEVADLIKAGLIIPPLELEKTYKGTHFKAVVRDDGTIEWDGQSYTSLSTAAAMARKSIVGKPLHTNGWAFWMYKDSQTGKLKEIDFIRKEYLQRHR